MHYDYLIVGAGLFGAVFAQKMKERGKVCLVIDKRDHIAGNIYTQEQLGIQVHKYGAHIFHTSDRRIWEYVQNFAEFNNYVNSPIARYHDELYNLPFNMNTFSKMWGVVTPAQAKQKIEEQKAEYADIEPKNLEEQALTQVGRDIYEKLIKGYTEKQWGRSCTELPSFIIRRLPVRFTYDNNYFNDPYQGIPVDGYTRMVERMLEGVEVRLNCSFSDPLFVERKRCEGCAAPGQSCEMGETEQVTWDKLVYTGPIDEYFNYELGHLEYRSLRFEEEELPEEDNYQGNAVVNYTEREIPYTRIIEHKHFTFGKGPGTVITREYPAEWKPGDEPYYPVNDEKNNSLAAKYKELAAREENVIFGGRLGQYQYYDMDKVIGAALQAVEEETQK